MDEVVGYDNFLFEVDMGEVPIVVALKPGVSDAMLKRPGNLETGVSDVLFDNNAANKTVCNSKTQMFFNTNELYLKNRTK